MTSTQSILLQTCRGEKTSRPPVWFMRQAGRILPNYNALKEKFTFKQMMENPELAADVTLMPIYDLDVDAAILFSDILVIPQAMGMDLQFPDSGPIFTNPLTSVSNPLSVLKANPDKLKYIYNVIDAIVEKKPEDIPLIGFCGSPFTVLLYMLQGLHKKSEFPDAIEYMYKNTEKTISILEAITELSLEYMKKQIEHGVDVFQLFDTHAGLIPFELYQKLVFPQVLKFAQVAREAKIPFIYFPKGIGVGIQNITPDMTDFVSVDWQTPIQIARKLLHSDIGIQGNIDPRILFQNKEEMLQSLEQYRIFGHENYNWICNLGHGFMPGLPYENAKLLVEWVKTTDWNRI